MALNRLLVPTFFGFIRKLVAVAIRQHMDCIEKSSVNKSKLKFKCCTVLRRWESIAGNLVITLG